jgi:group I intron endonuclease
MKITGIYQIKSSVNPKRVYIGSAINIEVRWGKHLERLRKNKHHSIKLQNHYNKYGESDLEFSILLGCDKEDLIKTEQYFIDSYKPFFNCSPTAGSCLGTKRSNESKKKIRQYHLGKKASEETKKKMSENMRGIKKSEKTKELIRINHVGAKGIVAWNKGLTKETDARVAKYIDNKIGKFTGENAPFYGRKHSPETILKMKESAKNRKRKLKKEN